MAKAEYWQKGSAIDYTNATATRIEANEIVPLTTRIGIAGMPIEAGATGTLLVEGVFILPLKSGESDMWLPVRVLLISVNSVRTRTRPRRSSTARSSSI